jgi:hypothetical protein
MIEGSGYCKCAIRVPNGLLDNLGLETRINIVNIKTWRRKSLTKFSAEVR